MCGLSIHPALVANCSHFLAVFHAVSARALLPARGTTHCLFRVLLPPSWIDQDWLGASRTPFSVFFLSSAIYQALWIYCLGKGFLSSCLVPILHFIFFLGGVVVVLGVSQISFHSRFLYSSSLLFVPSNHYTRHLAPHGAKLVPQPFLPSLVHMTLGISSEFFLGVAGLG